MSLSLLGLVGARKAAAKKSPRPALVSSFRPRVEALEDRLAPASPGSLRLPLDVQDVRQGANGGLEAVVALGSATDTVALDASTQQVAGEECPILNLHLGEIDLNLLGLGVHTSEICLDVTAVEGQGLLGSLLCDLSGGLDLGGILDQLDDVAGRLDTFLDQLDELLDDVLGQSMTVTGVLGQPVNGGGVGPASHEEEGVCDILNLSLGPVDLQVPLLGVNVFLDNCEGGPVTVDVTGNPEGGLLGQLLCGLADGLDNDLNLGGLIGRLDRLIDRLVDLADRLDDLDDLSDKLVRRVEKVIDRLEKLVDRVEDLRDLDRLIAGLDKALRDLDKILDRLG